MNSDFYTWANYLKNNGNVLSAKAVPFYDFINDAKRKRYYHYERPLLSGCRNRVTILDHDTNQQREMIMMGSNNYLGLSSHPKVFEAGLSAAGKYGFGSGGVPLFSGTYDLHKQLELKIAKLKGCEDAVIFSSGYTANIGCLTAIVGKDDLLILDRLSHASLMDGARFSGAELKIFKHNDMNHLEKLLKFTPGKGTRIIVVDGVYSMDGDIADLSTIRSLADKYHAMVMIDEAHATGVVGATGKGTPEHHEVQGKIEIVSGTFSKALAGVGGFIASTKEIVNYIRFYARSNMFSTSLPPATVGALIAAIDVLEKEPSHHQSLKENITYMTSNLKKKGLDVGRTESAILPIIVGDEMKLRKMAKFLHEEGLYVNPVPYPAVPKKQCRLRCSLMSTHTKADLERALQLFTICYEKFKLSSNGSAKAVNCA